MDEQLALLVQEVLPPDRVITGLLAAPEGFVLIRISIWEIADEILTKTEVLLIAL